MYPDWAVRQREWWKRGKHRTIMFIVCILCGHIPVASILLTSVITWDDHNSNLFHMSELSRCYFATLIFTFDMTNIMQVYFSLIQCLVKKRTFIVVFVTLFSRKGFRKLYISHNKYDPFLFVVHIFCT